MNARGTPARRIAVASACYSGQGGRGVLGVPPRIWDGVPPIQGWSTPLVQGWGTPPSKVGVPPPSKARSRYPPLPPSKAGLGYPPHPRLDQVPPPGQGWIGMGYPPGCELTNKLKTVPSPILRMRAVIKETLVFNLRAPTRGSPLGSVTMSRIHVASHAKFWCCFLILD